MQTLDQLTRSLAQDTSASISISGLRPSAVALLAAQTAAKSNKPALCVVAGESQAANLAQDLELFSNLPIHYYPGYEIPPYTPLSPDPQTTAQRLATLYQIRSTSTPYIVVASCEALLRKIMPAEILTNMAELIISGEETDREDLIMRLIQAGYEQMSLVQNSGEFSQRGGILDIFPPGFDYPIRLDFFGDFVESLRLFDPISQRSVKEIEEVEIIPASDILFTSQDQAENELFVNRLRTFAQKFSWARDEREVIFEKLKNKLKFAGIEFFLPLFHETIADPLSYLPTDSHKFIIDPHAITKSVDLIWERISTNYQEASDLQSVIMPPEELFMPQTEFCEQLQSNSVLLYDFEEINLESDQTQGRTPATTGQKINCGNHMLIKQHLELQRKKHGLLAPLSKYLFEWLEQGDAVFIACRSERQAKHLAQMLANHHLEVIIADGPALPLQINSSINLYPFPLSEGFDLLDEKIHFLSELELFGEMRLATTKRGKRKETEAPVNFDELKIGDIVVHNAHGLGIYDGIHNIRVGKLANDFLQIAYKDNDKLFVPVDRINTISKYNGLSDKTPKISRLGSKSWGKAKKKVQEAVWKVAQNLLNLYARRKLDTGHAFSRPDSMYQELEESFPYDETPGQARAINEVIDNLTAKQCMDRLVCGDVGFGKTEVAIRAAFKVVADGFQVAMLVPTTVLAEQHSQTFKERFQGFPVNVECLNRFRSGSEQRRIVKKLQEGKVDIIIGTHRILSKDVSFHNLGLLIIDEEHRFGVTHKEKLKLLRTGIDVLTLTATPIPRTLQMSLLGVRDLSVISSPPRNRRTVKTFIAKYTDLVIKEAIVKELQRGGQVFLVHNRVHSIHDLAFKVQKLVPDAKIAVAHGQMPGKNLEEIMVSFVHKDINVLICTTIIESGLDIPNANTIIINRADRMGLAEIYQLRGRVGRSNEQAYAYLLVPSVEHMSKDAKQRLRALMEYSELGGGFKLALSDLQIRGGGNILGESQSGNIAAIGYDLYLDLLQQTVEDLKRRAETGDKIIEEDIEPEVNLQISAFIAESYVPDPDQRYIAYRRISSLHTEKELNDLAEEFADRFGKLPQETVNLFSVVALKEELKPLKIVKLEQGPSSLVFSFVDNTPVSPQHILLFIQNSKNDVRLTPDGKLVVQIPTASTESIFDIARKILRSIW